MSGSATSFTTARFLTPDYHVQGQDNLLSCPLWRDGALVVPTESGSTITIYDGANNVVVDGEAVAVAASIATFTLAAASVPTTLSRGMGWRSEWRLVEGGTPTVYRNSGALVRSRLAPMVTDADLFRRESGLNPSGNAPLSTLTNYQPYLDEAWITIHGRLAGRGSIVHLVMDPSALRESMLLLTLHLIFEDFRTRLNETFDQKARDYLDRFTAEWAGLTFSYDASDSGAGSLRRRSASPSLWMGGFDVR